MSDVTMWDPSGDPFYNPYDNPSSAVVEFPTSVNNITSYDPLYVEWGQSPAPVSVSNPLAPTLLSPPTGIFDVPAPTPVTPRPITSGGTAAPGILSDILKTIPNTVLNALNPLPSLGELFNFSKLGLSTTVTGANMDTNTLMLMMMMMNGGGGGMSNMLLMLMLMGGLGSTSNSSNPISSMLPMLMVKSMGTRAAFPLLGVLGLVPPTIAAMGSLMGGIGSYRPRTRVIYRRSYSRRRRY